MKKIAAITALGVLTIGGAKAADEYWRTDGTSATWTGANWSATGSAPFTTAWTSGSNAVFQANSTITFATTTVGNITVADGVTVTVSQAGTLSTGGAARTIDVGTGSLLTWTTQNVSTSASQAGFIKTGAGTWNIGAQGNAYNATNFGFTLNDGTVIVSGNNSFGGANSLLTINGGTIQSSGTRAYANNIVIGGNFEQTGTGNATFSGTVALGSATRTITNNTTSGSRVFSGVISSTGTAGLTFAGTGAGQAYIGNAGNTFTGTITINGSEVGFASDGALGNSANTVVIDGGRLTSTSTAGSAVTSTWSATHGIQVGDTAGTSISVQGGAGDLTYNGVISDVSGKTGSWAKQGAGILRLGGVSTFSGNLSVNNGTVQMTTGSNRLPTGTTVSLGQASSTNLGTLDLNGQNQQIAGLNSTTGTNSGASKNTVTSTGAATLTLGGSGTYSFGDGTNANSGVLTGSLAIVKTGSGTQTFGDANTFSGGTTISGGKLVTANASALGAGNVAVSGGTLDLNGASTIALTLGSGAVFTMDSGTLAMTVASLASFDSIGGGTSATFTGGTLDLTGSTLAAGSYQVFTGFSGAVTGSLTVTGYDTNAFSATFANGTLNVTAVPESTTTAIGVVGLLGAILLFRRKFSRE